MKQWVFVVLCLLSCSSAIASDNRVSQYTLKQQHIGDSQNALLLINCVTGQTIWKKQFAGSQLILDCIGWSPNHKAVALSIFTESKTPFRLLIWQVGKPVRLLDDSAIPSGGYIDGVINFVWSPDNRHVLYRVYQSGGKIMNQGYLYCLDTKNWHFSTVLDAVTSMHWLSPNKVQYWVNQYKIVAHGKDYAAIKSVHSRFWNID